MKRHLRDDEILAGGQGRTAGDIEAASHYVLVCVGVLLVLICVLALSGCARPTAHVAPHSDTSASERPDRPRWDDLRQQFGGM